MSSFFGGASQSGVGLDDNDIQTIVNAKNAALQAVTDAQTALSGAQSAQTAAAVSAEASASSVSAAATLASTAEAEALLASQWATQTSAPVDIVTGGYGAAKYAADASTSATAADTSNQSASDASAAAQVAAISAQAWASSPAGQVVGAGLESALSYAARAAAVASSTLAMPVRDLLDADFAGGNYSLRAADLGYVLRCNNASAGNIVLPAGLWTGPGPTADHSIAAAKVLNKGAGGVTFSTASSVIAPQRLIDQSFAFTVATALATKTGSHSVSVPAGSNRTVIIMSMSIHSVAVASGDITLTATNTAGLTKSVTEQGSGLFSALQPCGALWKATIAGTAATTVVVAPVYPNVYAYVLWVLVCANVASVTGTTGTAAVSAGTPDASLALTPAEAKDMLVFGYSMCGGDALPLVLAGGITPTQAQTGNSGGVRTGKDIAYITGYEVVPNTSVETYTFNNASLGRPGVKLGAILKPATAASVTLNGSPGTMSTVGQMADILAEDDGVTYNVRVI